MIVVKPSSPKNLNRLPMASSFGQKRSAIVSFTMTTSGAPVASVAREVAAAQERDADRVEVAGADRVHLHEDAIPRRRVLAFGKDAAQQAAGERRVLRDRRHA